MPSYWRYFAATVGGCALIGLVSALAAGMLARHPVLLFLVLACGWVLGWLNGSFWRRLYVEAGGRRL
jgi:hypothetical protein